VPERGWPSSPLIVPTSGYPATTTTRRRRGEDGISFEHRGPCRDPQRHRHCPGLWRGEITLGYTGDGKRARRKVSGTTKAAVVDKLRDLHLQLDKGITPKAGYTHYTVRQAAQDWLVHGLDGRSPKTIKKNQNVLEPILTVVGARKLRDLTAPDVRQALAAMAARYSTAAVSMGHLALKRAIRHAEANDLVSRNVAALADTPRGQEGRPSKSLTLEQAVAVTTTARTLPVMELRPGLKDVRRPAALMHAYIVLSLLCGLRTEEARALRWAHVDLDGDPKPARPSRRMWPSGDRSARTARPRPNGPAAPSASPRPPFRRCVPGLTARPVNGSQPGTTGRTPGWCSPRTTAPPSTPGTSARCSNGSATRPGSATGGRPANCGPPSSA
jgi:integrase